MENDQIGRIGHSGRHHDPAWLPAVRTEREKPDAETRRATDEVELTAPHNAVMRLLRTRVLEVTRTELGLSKEAVNNVHFAAPPAPRPEVFVGRLISSQNLMAGHRRGQWSSERIDAATSEGMVRGIEETIDILQDLGDLDDENWTLIAAVLDEFHRKIAAAMEPRIDPDSAL